MNRYIKPNVNLPISLHDARVSELQVFPASQIKQDGTLMFIFENGVRVINNSKILQTGKATIKCSGIDFDFSHVYYYRENRKRKISFEQLAKDIKENSFDIMDEYYGYNLSKFNGNLITADGWYDVDIEIYHFYETIYEWTNYS